MAGLAHLGVGMAAKRVLPGVPAPVLVAAAYGIDIAWAGFWAAGLERFPEAGVVSTAPWSHGLFMSVVWSVAAGLVALLITRNRRTSLLMGLLVFSHWIVDFIAKPMTHAFPSDSGLPLLFGGSPIVGLGVWGTAAGEFVGEYGTAALGILVYILTRFKLKAHKRATC
ncbi:MAG TPA: hypothetical protein VNT75_15170 [Symbiobacteriaceae bacterium]|nr:hypothetical protein [Symbiobacteriaceae bacterium]